MGHGTERGESFVRHGATSRPRGGGATGEQHREEGESSGGARDFHAASHYSRSAPDWLRLVLNRGLHPEDTDLRLGLREGGRFVGEKTKNLVEARDLEHRAHAVAQAK